MGSIQTRNLLNSPTKEAKDGFYPTTTPVQMGSGRCQQRPGSATAGAGSAAGRAAGEEAGGRGRGRDDYPVRACWNALVAGVVYQHPSAAALPRELRRNGELRAARRFNPLLGVAAAPPEWAFSRFLQNVIEQEEEVQRRFRRWVERVARELPDLGRHLAVDGKAIPSHGTGRKNRETGATSDPEAAWGVKTCRGERNGKPYEKVTKWFGHTLHLTVDATHELPLAYALTPADVSETTRLVPLVEQLNEKTPTVYERAETLAADRGYDSAENHRRLWEEHTIKGVIDIRALWKAEKAEQGRDPAEEIIRPCFRSGPT